MILSDTAFECGIFSPPRHESTKPERIWTGHPVPRKARKTRNGASNLKNCGCDIIRYNLVKCGLRNSSPAKRLRRAACEMGTGTLTPSPSPIRWARGIFFALYPGCRSRNRFTRGYHRAAPPGLRRAEFRRAAWSTGSSVPTPCAGRGFGKSSRRAVLKLKCQRSVHASRWRDKALRRSAIATRGSPPPLCCGATSPSTLRQDETSRGIAPIHGQDNN